MECDDLLEGYSEFVDGQLDPSVRAAFEAHIDVCESCARYHRVVQRGLFVYRNLPQLQPSPDFFPRLRHCLYHLEDEARLSERTPLGSAALVAVGTVGFLALAWLPFATRLTVEVELPPVAVEAPAAHEISPSLFGSGPFLAPVDRYAVPAAGWGYATPTAAWSFGPAGLSWPTGSDPEAFFRRGAAVRGPEAALATNVPAR